MLKGGLFTVNLCGVPDTRYTFQVTSTVNILGRLQLVPLTGSFRCFNILLPPRGVCYLFSVSRRSKAIGEKDEEGSSFWLKGIGI